MAPETATSRSGGRRASWVRAALLLLVLGLLTLETPTPWAWLWLAVPTTAALALLLCWRFGTAAVAVVAVGAVGLTVAGSAHGLWLWWIPAAALVGAWMGVREEGGGPTAGQRAWMLAPALVLAALLPWLSHYQETVAAVDRSLVAGDAQMMELMRQLGTSRDRLGGLEKAVTQNAALRHAALPHVIPTVLFLWVAVLLVLGRTLAARLARALRWPRLSRLNLREWRLPDGALWTFIAGLALVLTPWPAWAPTGWTLLLNAGLGFCVQGVAVVESLMLARGIPLSIIVLTMVFVIAMALQVFVVATAALGLSDVWLDFRRLEATREGDGA